MCVGGVSAFLRHTPCLHKAGYGVLLFDCREHGLSDAEGRGVSLGTRESEDVHAVAQFLKSSNFQKPLFSRHLQVSFSLWRRSAPGTFGYEFVVSLGTSQVCAGGSCGNFFSSPAKSASFPFPWRRALRPPLWPQRMTTPPSTPWWRRIRLPRARCCWSTFWTACLGACHASFNASRPGREGRG